MKYIFFASNSVLFRTAIMVYEVTSSITQKRHSPFQETVPGRIITTLIFEDTTIDTCIEREGFNENEAVFFPDVPQDVWYAKYVCQAKASGIVNGLGDGTFAPNNPVTRAEAVKLLLSAKETPLISEKNPFSDISENEWFTDFVLTATKKGIVEGMEKDGVRYFAPHKPLTRAEMAKVVVKVFGF
jgi:hypothetical protein